MAQSEQEVLAERLSRYPLERYPVQHATTQFHLGSVLLQAEETAGALQALTAARDVFALVGMRLEQAKATMMLGVALRAAGRGDQAASAFVTAREELAAVEQPAEQAAASYNLGLVRQDAGDLPAAHAAWEQARELFVSAGYPAQAGAAARDHGASLLASGEAARAVPLLEQALSLAELAGDEAGLGAAANVLGLAQLADEQSAAAVCSLRRAMGAFPRSTRPAEHAMVKANLALAHEQAGDSARARLAAAQALAVPSAAPPVRTQAAQLLERRPGRLADDLLAVLLAVDGEQRAGVLRDEVLRVVGQASGEQRALVAGLLDGILAQPALAYDLAEALLTVLLELPPRPYELMVGAVVGACTGRSAEHADRLRSVLGSALARFAMPQWQRLAASLNAAAVAAGEPATWS